MQGPAKQNALAAYGLLLAAVLLAWGLCMAGAGIWPFGGQTLAPIDNMQQQAPDFGAISRLLDGTGGLGWSYASGGAVRVFLTPFSHNVLFPTTWLAWLMPWGDILQALSWQLLFQLMLAATTCCWYLRRRFRGAPWLLQVALAFSYAFSHFFLTKYLCLNFLNIYAVFPLFLAALDALLERGRIAGYVILMTFMMGFAGYFAWMYGLFALVYTMAERRPSRLWGRRGRMALLAGATVAALALSAVCWLPDVMHMAGSSRADSVSTEALRGGCLYPDEVTLWTLTPLACACLCAASPRRLKGVLLAREGLTAMALCLCLLFSAATFIWCLGTPVYFKSRFSYMAVMMLCCMACRVGKWAGRRVWIRRYGVLLLGMGVLVGIGFRFLRFEPYRLHAAIAGFAIAAGMLPLLGACVRRMPLVLAVCMAGAVAAFLGYDHFHRGFVSEMQELRVERVQHDLLLPQILADKPMEAGDRVKSMDLALMENSGEYTGLNRFTDYIQSSTAQQQETLFNLGYFDWWTRKMDLGGTTLSDSFLGFRYFVSETPLPAGLAPCIHAGQGVYVYANPYYWGVGALVRRQDIQPAPQDARPVEHQLSLYRLLAGADAPPVLRQSPAPVCGAWCYADAGAGSECFDASVLAGLKELGGVPHSRTLLLLAQSANAGRGIPCHVLDGAAMDALAERQRGKVEVLRVKTDGVELRLHPEAGQDMLLFPLLYHKGYSATCAGASAEVVDALGFVGVVLPENVADGAVVTLEFRKPYRGVGAVVSVIGGLVLAAWLLIRRRRGVVPGAGRLVQGAGACCVAVGYAVMVFCTIWTLYWCLVFLLGRV